MGVLRRVRLRSRLSEAQGHRCCYCGIALAASGMEDDSATLEHVIPLAAGGWSGWMNIVVACRFCNLGRGAMMATTYFDLVRRFGRAAAHAKGRAWYKRQMSCGPDGAKRTCRKQHFAGPVYRALRHEYRQRIASPPG
ncbi:MAG: HNH endonuclease [Rhizomicrobium sp.]